MASGLFIPTFRDILDASQLAIDLDAETHRVALFSNALAANFSTNTAYGVAPFNANEVVGTGYTAGGVLLTGTTFTEDPAGTLKFDANDVSWTNASITARYALVYADGSAGNEAIALLDFGSDFTSTNGTFSVQWPTAGIWTWKVVP